jgi:hypothetical protein
MFVRIADGHLVKDIDQVDRGPASALLCFAIDNNDLILYKYAYRLCFIDN